MHKQTLSPSRGPVASVLCAVLLSAASLRAEADAPFPPAAIVSGFVSSAPQPDSAADAPLSAELSPAPSSPAKRAPSADPGMAATLGVIPIASGFYATSKTEVGYLFTAVDLVLIGAIFAARGDDASYKKNSESVYWGALIAANLADAYFSYRQAKQESRLAAAGGMLPDGSWKTVLTWKF